MRLLTLITSILFTFTSLQASAFEKVIKYRNIKVEMVSEKPLTTGMNRIKLHLFKRSNPIKSADVTIKFFMPAMPGMPYMEYKTEAKPLGDGVYEALFNASMGGTWQVHIFVTTKDGKKYRLKSSVNL